ncbi:ABC transporter permease [Liquorilactobacillus oeni DSM 19972]|uniref:ABC transporter permease n=1 Tax=Liquorilactobacillus oeni DSM 19972 TaxID=1423777 RepID=A0A0R1MGZ1_9LACO|nr:ABC transporter permease [Liquorilactobacillus oeni DSM 19972]
MIVGWLILIVGLMGGAAAKFDSIYGTKAALASIVTTLKTPAMKAMFGSFTAKPPYTSAIIYASEMMVFMGLVFAMMNIYFAVKNSRTEEDNGTLELIRAHSVGKLSPLIAVIIELFVINLINGVLIAISLEFAGMTGTDILGNCLFGLGLAAFGFMFGMMSLLVSQLANNSRGATILSYLILGFTYIARMLTDVKNTNYTWITMFGLIEKLEIYTENNWLPVLYMVLSALLLLFVTIFASTHRDVAAGLIPTRPGRRNASFLLANPFSLILRLERISLIIWTCGLFVLGISYGSIFGNIGNLLKTNPSVAKLIGSSAIKSSNHAIILNFAATLSVVFAVIATIPAVITILRINNDEKKGWLEQIHARGISRSNIFFSYIAVALLCEALCLLVALLGMGFAGMSAKDPVSLLRFLRAFSGYLPAIYVVSGIAALFTALFPKIQNIVWILPIYGLFSMYFGNLLNFPKWAKQLTPYGWVNRVPLKEVQWNNGVVMIGLTLGLFLISYLIYSKRDLLES